MFSTMEAFFLLSELKKNRQWRELVPNRKCLAALFPYFLLLLSSPNVHNTKKEMKESQKETKLLERRFVRKERNTHKKNDRKGKVELFKYK